MLSMENRNVPKKKSWSQQFPATISACLMRLGFGTVIFWSSPAVPYLTSGQSRLAISKDEASWVISLVSIGEIISFLLYPLFINRIGRKYTMLLFAIPSIFSWLLIYYASHVHHLYFARILSGIGYTAGSTAEIIYVGEIADKNIRGFLFVLGKFSFCLGGLITVVLGTLVTYDNMNLILLIIPLLFILTFSFMPESPYFYLKINEEENAFQSLAKLRGSRDVQRLQLEIDNMKKGMIKHTFSEKHSLIQLFRIRKNRRALLIVFLATMSVVFSGTMIIAPFMQTIVSYNDNLLKPEHETILIVLVVLISTILISPMPDYLGRRILTLWFGIFTALSSGTIGVCLFCKYYLRTENLSSISWLPLVAFIVYSVASNSGLLCISSILMGELFSLEVKGLATAMINIIFFVLTFLLKLVLERLIRVIEIYGIFWMFSILSFLITLINFLIMPETKGMTLEDIQKVLARMK